MILAAPHLLLALRWVPPAFALMGSTATYISAWALIRLLTLPLSERCYRRAEETLYASYQRLVGFLFETWSGVEFHFYGDPLPDAAENVLYISNHQCTVDWVVAETLCLRQGGYGGRNRYILKDSLKYVPLYGWQLGARGGVFVKRHKDKDQEKIIRRLNELVEKDINTWLVIFPEGTRFDPRNPKSIRTSQEQAMTLGIPRLNHVLSPRTTGFELVLTHIKRHFKAVYDVTIMYDGPEVYKRETLARLPAPDMFRFFSGYCTKVHIHIRRIPIELLPDTPEEQRKWLYSAYMEKERLIHTLLTDGKYNQPELNMPLPLRVTQTSVLFYLASLVAVVTSPYGASWWVGTIGLFSAIGLARVRTL
ncbi:hypothetical protein EMCRGX_G004255 [Ephydatia muelleri]